MPHSPFSAAIFMFFRCLRSCFPENYSNAPSGWDSVFGRGKDGLFAMRHFPHFFRRWQNCAGRRDCAGRISKGYNRSASGTASPHSIRLKSVWFVSAFKASSSCVYFFSCLSSLILVFIGRFPLSGPIK